ncbi:unnamed protein product [Miscanthus lutarioriparius]|uniref:Uncharacterized protein n=1 Tax=Miscanthus lutarioriparius TaxID=422564 RepID=A0A811Q567_9POAL|nr:unnamed protein product [Miscanthus lutarioriparius]
MSGTLVATAEGLLAWIADDDVGVGLPRAENAGGDEFDKDQPDSKRSYYKCTTAGCPVPQACAARVRRPAHRDHHVRRPAQRRRAHRAWQRRTLPSRSTACGQRTAAGQNLAVASATRPTMVDRTAQKCMFSGQGSFGLGGALAQSSATSGSFVPSSFLDNTMGSYMSQQQERQNAAPREDMFSPQSTD